MDLRISIVFLCIGISGSFALHIIMSPDEAEKIMKRDDEFSKGLAGFVDTKMTEGTSGKTDKRQKLNELKRLVTNALEGLKQSKDKKDEPVSLEIKKDASRPEKPADPPALPLDVKETKADDLAGLEKLVDGLMKEVNKNKKRNCHDYNCMTNYGREAKHTVKAKASTDDQLEEIYTNVKRLVKTQIRDHGNSKKSSTRNQVVSDSGDVGDRMLAKVNAMLKKQAAGESTGLLKDKPAVNDGGNSGRLESKIDKLLHTISQLTKKDASKDVGELTLNAVKKMVAEKEAVQRPKVAKEVKDQNNVDLLGIKKEIKELLSKINTGKNDVSNHANEVAMDDVAVENEAEKKSVKIDKRRAMIVDLLKSYDALTKRNSAKRSDVYANELETASVKYGTKVSKKTAGSMKGFDIDTPKERRSHPK